MAKDPRTFLSISCGPTRADIVAADAKKRNFFSDLGKIGDLEILNSINAGKIGEGLRTLASISDSIRNGKPGASGLFGVGAIAGAVLDSVNASAEAATNAVLSAVGINATAATIARDFNPGVVNRAFGQAKAIAGKVKAGRFKVRDIPSYFQDIQNLDILLAGIYTPDGENVQKEVCEPSPYATDLVARQPKFKFLFVVEFIPNAQFKDNFRRVDIAFVVHTSSRPNIEFEYEDINMYNLRTRVAKKTLFQPMTMRFYDDDFNHAFTFYTRYLNLMSPVTNFFKTGEPNFKDNGLQGAYDSYHRLLGNTGSLGALAGNSTETILDEIRLYHLFNWGQNMNIYRFYNPRITTMELDELSMAESGPTEVSLQFAYDGVHIIPQGEWTAGADNLEQRKVNLKDKQAGAFYPLQYRGGDYKKPFNGAEDIPETSVSGSDVILTTVEVPPNRQLTMEERLYAFNPTSEELGKLSSGSNNIDYQIGNERLKASTVSSMRTDLQQQRIDIVNSPADATFDIDGSTLNRQQALTYTDRELIKVNIAVQQGRITTEEINHINTNYPVSSS